VCGGEGDGGDDCDELVLVGESGGDTPGVSCSLISGEMEELLEERRLLFRRLRLAISACC